MKKIIASIEDIEKIVGLAKEARDLAKELEPSVYNRTEIEIDPDTGFMGVNVWLEMAPRRYRCVSIEWADRDGDLKSILSGRIRNAVMVYQKRGGRRGSL